MNTRNMPEQAIVSALAKQYYDVVPRDLLTYCSVTSRITQAVLGHFGVAAELVPCQVWLNMPGKSCIVGFLGKAPAPGKWDGHVVCSTQTSLIDAALHHFTKEFGHAVPHLVVAQKIPAQTQVLGRHDLSETDRLWWHLPPQGVDVTPPHEPADIVSSCAAQLIDSLELQFSQATDHA